MSNQILTFTQELFELKIHNKTVVAIEIKCFPKFTIDLALNQKVMFGIKFKEINIQKYKRIIDLINVIYKSDKRFFWTEPVFSQLKFFWIKAAENASGI